MTPSRLREPMPWEPLFEELSASSYRFQESNDLSRGTYPVPGFSVEARLDWIVVKALGATEPSVVSAPFSERLGRPVSDHHAARVRVTVASRADAFGADAIGRQIEENPAIEGPEPRSGRKET